MIHCRTYLGEVRHGDHVRVDAHDAIVTPDCGRAPEPARSAHATRHIPALRPGALLGLLAADARLQRRPEEAAVYVCTTPECPNRYSTVVIARLDSEATDQFFRRLGAFHARRVDSGELDAARQEVERLTEQVELLAEVVPIHRAAIQAHQRKLGDAERELSEAEARLDDLLARQQDAGVDARTLHADWPSLTLAQRRELLRAGIDTILVRRASRMGPDSPLNERILILWHGDAPAELRTPARSPSAVAWDDHPGSLRAL